MPRGLSAENPRNITNKRWRGTTWPITMHPRVTISSHEMPRTVYWVPQEPASVLEMASAWSVPLVGDTSLFFLLLRIYKSFCMVQNYVCNIQNFGIEIGQHVVNCQLSHRCQPVMKWCLANTINIIFMVLWSNNRSKLMISANWL